MREIMSGLLMKDLELLKVNIKTYFIVFAVGIIYLFVQTDGSIFFISYMIFVSLSVTVGTISYDGYHHGMNFLMTLPVTRKQYVWSKYLLGFCFAAVTGMAALLIGILKVQVTGNQEMQDLLISAGVSMILAGMILCGTIPLRLKYEAEKSRIIMVAAAAALFLLVAVCREGYNIYKKGFVRGFEFLERISGWQTACLMIVLLMICTAVSVKVSERIMERKEF